LVEKHIGAEQLGNVAEFVKIDENTIDLIKRAKGGVKWTPDLGPRIAEVKV
jgi:hypothetical protein